MEYSRRFFRGKWAPLLVDLVGDRVHSRWIVVGVFVLVFCFLMRAVLFLAFLRTPLESSTALGPSVMVNLENSGSIPRIETGRALAVPISGKITGADGRSGIEGANLTLVLSINDIESQVLSRSFGLNGTSLDMAGVPLQQRYSLPGMVPVVMQIPTVSGVVETSDVRGYVRFRHFRVVSAIPGTYMAQLQYGSVLSAPLRLRVTSAASVVEVQSPSLITGPAWVGSAAFGGSDRGVRIGELLPTLRVRVLDASGQPLADKAVRVKSAALSTDELEALGARPSMLQPRIALLESTLSSVTGSDGVATFSGVRIAASSLSTVLLEFVCDGVVGAERISVRVRDPTRVTLLNELAAETVEGEPFPVQPVVRIERRQGTFVNGSWDSNAWVPAVGYRAVALIRNEAGIESPRMTMGPNMVAEAAWLAGDLTANLGRAKHLVHLVSEPADSTGTASFTKLGLTRHGPAGIYAVAFAANGVDINPRASSSTFTVTSTVASVELLPPKAPLETDPGALSYITYDGTAATLPTPVYNLSVCNAPSDCSKWDPDLVEDGLFPPNNFPWWFYAQDLCNFAKGCESLSPLEPIWCIPQPVLQSGFSGAFYAAPVVSVKDAQGRPLAGKSATFTIQKDGAVVPNTRIEEHPHPGATSSDLSGTIRMESTNPTIPDQERQAAAFARGSFGSYLRLVHSPTSSVCSDVSGNCRLVASVEGVVSSNSQATIAQNNDDQVALDECASIEILEQPPYLRLQTNASSAVPPGYRFRVRATNSRGEPVAVENIRMHVVDGLGMTVYMGMIGAAGPTSWSDPSVFEVGAFVDPDYVAAVHRMGGMHVYVSSGLTSTLIPPADSADAGTDGYATFRDVRLRPESSATHIRVGFVASRFPDGDPRNVALDYWQKPGATYACVSQVSSAIPIRADMGDAVWSSPDASKLTTAPDGRAVVRAVADMVSPWPVIPVATGYLAGSEELFPAKDMQMMLTAVVDPKMRRYPASAAIGATQFTWWDQFKSNTDDDVYGLGENSAYRAPTAGVLPRARSWLLRRNGDTIIPALFNLVARPMLGSRARLVTLGDSDSGIFPGFLLNSVESVGENPVIAKNIGCLAGYPGRFEFSGLALGVTADPLTPIECQPSPSINDIEIVDWVPSPAPINNSQGDWNGACPSGSMPSCPIVPAGLPGEGLECGGPQRGTCFCGTCLCIDGWDGAADCSMTYWDDARGLYFSRHEPEKSKWGGLVVVDLAKYMTAAWQPAVGSKTPAPADDGSEMLPRVVLARTATVGHRDGSTFTPSPHSSLETVLPFLVHCETLEPVKSAYVTGWERDDRCTRLPLALSSNPTGSPGESNFDRFWDDPTVSVDPPYPVDLRLALHDVPSGCYAFRYAYGPGGDVSKAPTASDGGDQVLRVLNNVTARAVAISSAISRPFRVLAPFESIKVGNSPVSLSVPRDVAINVSINVHLESRPELRDTTLGDRCGDKAVCELVINPQTSRCPSLPSSGIWIIVDLVSPDNVAYPLYVAGETNDCIRAAKDSGSGVYSYTASLATIKIPTLPDDPKYAFQSSVSPSAGIRVPTGRNYRLRFRSHGLETVAKTLITIVDLPNKMSVAIHDDSGTSASSRRTLFPARGTMVRNDFLDRSKRSLQVGSILNQLEADVLVPAPATVRASCAIEPQSNTGNNKLVPVPSAVVRVDVIDSPLSSNVQLDAGTVISLSDSEGMAEFAGVRFLKGVPGTYALLISTDGVRASTEHVVVATVTSPIDAVSLRVVMGASAASDSSTISTPSRSTVESWSKNKNIVMDAVDGVPVEARLDICINLRNDKTIGALLDDVPGSSLFAQAVTFLPLTASLGDDAAQDNCKANGTAVGAACALNISSLARGNVVEETLALQAYLARGPREARTFVDLGIGGGAGAALLASSPVADGSLQTLCQSVRKPVFSGISESMDVELSYSVLGVESNRVRVRLLTVEDATKWELNDLSGRLLMPVVAAAPVLMANSLQVHAAVRVICWVVALGAGIWWLERETAFRTELGVLSDTFIEADVAYVEVLQVAFVLGLVVFFFAVVATFVASGPQSVRRLTAPVVVARHDGVVVRRLSGCEGLRMRISFRCRKVFGDACCSGGLRNGQKHMERKTTEPQTSGAHFPRPPQIGARDIKYLGRVDSDTGGRVLHAWSSVRVQGRSREAGYAATRDVFATWYTAARVPRLVAPLRARTPARAGSGWYPRRTLTPAAEEALALMFLEVSDGNKTLERCGEKLRKFFLQAHGFPNDDVVPQPDNTISLPIWESILASRLAKRGLTDLVLDFAWMLRDTTGMHATISAPWTDIADGTGQNLGPRGRLLAQEALRACCERYSVATGRGGLAGTIPVGVALAELMRMTSDRGPVEGGLLWIENEVFGEHGARETPGYVVVHQAPGFEGWCNWYEFRLGARGSGFDDDVAVRVELAEVGIDRHLRTQVCSLEGRVSWKLMPRARIVLERAFLEEAGEEGGVVVLRKRLTPDGVNAWRKKVFGLSAIRRDFLDGAADGNGLLGPQEYVVALCRSIGDPRPSLAFQLARLGWNPRLVREEDGAILLRSGKEVLLGKLSCEEVGWAGFRVPLMQLQHLAPIRLGRWPLEHESWVNRWVRGAVGWTRGIPNEARGGPRCMDVNELSAESYASAERWSMFSEPRQPDHNAAPPPTAGMATQWSCGKLGRNQSGLESSWDAARPGLGDPTVRYSSRMLIAFALSILGVLFVALLAMSLAEQGRELFLTEWDNAIEGQRLASLSILDTIEDQTLALNSAAVSAVDWIEEADSPEDFEARSDEVRRSLSAGSNIDPELVDALQQTREELESIGLGDAISAVTAAAEGDSDSAEESLNSLASNDKTRGAVFAAGAAIMSENGMEDFESLRSTIKSSMVDIALVCCIIAGCFLLLSWLLALRNYRRVLVLARRGRWPLVIANVKVGKAAVFIGLSLAQSILSFFFLASVFFIVVFLFTWEDSRDYIWESVEDFLPSLLGASIVISILELVLLQYLLAFFTTIHHRRLFILADGIFAVANLFNGAVVAAIRFVVSLLFLGIGFARTDVSNLPRSVQHFDPSIGSFDAMLFLDVLQNHPLYLALTNFLVYDLKTTHRSSIYQRDVPNTPSPRRASAAAPSIELASLVHNPLRISPESQPHSFTPSTFKRTSPPRLRRWIDLAILLHQNPSLRSHRRRDGANLKTTVTTHILDRLSSWHQKE